MTMLPHSRWSGRSVMPSGPGWMSPSPGSVAACLVWFNADTKDNAVGKNNSNLKTPRSISMPQMNISTGSNSHHESDRQQQTSRTQKTLDLNIGLTVQDERTCNSTETTKAETQRTASDDPRTNRQDRGTTPRHSVPQSNATHKEASPRVSSILNSSRAAVNAAFSSSNKFTQTKNTSSKTVPLQEDVAIQAVHDSFNRPSMCLSRRPSKHQTASPLSPSRPPPSCSANKRSVELKRDEQDNLTNLVIMRPNTPLRKKSAVESGAKQTMHLASYRHTSSSIPGRRQQGRQGLADRVRQSEQLFKRVVQQLNTGQAMIPAKSNPIGGGFSLLGRSTSYVDLGKLIHLSEETKENSQSQRTGGYGARSNRPCSAGSSSHERGDEHQRQNSLNRFNLQLTIRLK